MHTSNGLPPAAAVRVQLDRILASEAFANAGRLSRFLRFIVEGTLDGHGDRLKEYAVGLEVFDRADDYDPRIDSIVRVEARRLRSKLTEYYTTAGEADDLVIGLRKGSYVPYFEPRAAVSVPLTSGEALTPSTSQRRRRVTPAMASAIVLAAGVLGWLAWQGRASWAQPVTDPTAISVAVLPMQHHANDADSEMIATRLTDGMTSALARFPALTVRSRTSALQFVNGRPALRDVARALDARFIVEGSVLAADGSVRADVRLVEATTDRKVWVHELTVPAADIGELPRQFASAIAVELTRRGRSDASPR